MKSISRKAVSEDIPGKIQELQAKLQDVVAEVAWIRDELQALESQHHLEEQPDHRTTILIVDDARLVRTLISGILTSAGHSVLEAESVALALELLDDQKCDLIIVDIHMPDAGGPELLKAIRVDRNQVDLPVLVCSGSRERTDYQKVAQYGVQGVIQKPVNKKDLLTKVDDILQQHAGRNRGGDWEIFDPDQALERFGGDVDLLKEMAGIFQSEALPMLAKIRKAVTGGSSEDRNITTRELAEAVGNLSARRAEAAVQSLDELDDNTDEKEERERYTVLEQEVHTLREAIDQFLRQ